MDKLEVKSNQLLDRLEQEAQSNPVAVVISAHHFFRNLYPHDPHITNNNSKKPIERIEKAIDESFELLDLMQRMGMYTPLLHQLPKNNGNNDIKVETGEVYGEMWKDFDQNALTNKAQKILDDRFESNGLSETLLRNGIVLDAGCGSGRFTLALAKYQPKELIGIDFGAKGIAIARTLLDIESQKTIKFVQGDLVSLPFPNEYFDFVFSNGTAHHTSNPTKAIQELIRVTKTGGSIFLYLYGDGGIFWNSRKRMNRIMKKIPQNVSRQVLEGIGMPLDRFIFEDNWYVPIEEHTTPEYLEELLRASGVESFRRLTRGRETDLPVPSTAAEKLIYGAGELRYLVKK